MKYAFLAIIVALALALPVVCADFNSEREEMASSLYACRDRAQSGDWSGCTSALSDAKAHWQTVKPEFSQREYYRDRVQAVESQLSIVQSGISEKNPAKTASAINETLWQISHWPEGFYVQEDSFGLGDWAVAGFVGLGYVAFAIFAGLYLRRSYRGGN